MEAVLDRKRGTGDRYVGAAGSGPSFCSGAAGRQGSVGTHADACGVRQHAAQQATIDGTGFLHITGTTTGGYVVSWGKSAGTVGGARAYGPDGAPLAPEQVAGLSWHTGAGPRGSMAPLAGGGAAIVGQVVDGTPVGPQTRINLITTPTAGTEILVLADGSFSIAWDVGRTRYARTFGSGGLVAP